MEPTELCKLGVKYHTDKTPFIEPPTHDYTPYYHELFKGRTVKKVLEIGVAAGASLRMWQDYFNEAEIYGLDIDPQRLFNEGRIKTFLCDQGDANALRELAMKLGGNFDIILDDGSHESVHQSLSARVLVPFVAPGGVYIIEDVCHPEEVVPHLPFPHEVVPRRLDLLSDDRLIVIRR